MAHFIITSEPFEQFNYKKESLGMSEKLAVFYSPKIGRTRFYRQSLANPQKGLKLLTFKTKKRAKQVCDATNEVSAIKFKVEVVND